MDFGLLPPEVSSARMYTGPGPESMQAAANAWDGLAGELSSAAISYESVVSGLLGEPWVGPAAASMAAAAAPYMGWLTATAVQAEQAANQARTAASAFDTAFGMMVPPPAIEANRSQLMSLVSTNTLGQNSATIAIIQAEYAEMWAQDAAAMFAYAGTSLAASSALTPFSQPSPTADAAGPAAMAEAAGAAVAAALTPTFLTQLAALPSPVDALTSELAGLVPSFDGQSSAAPITIPTPIGELEVVGLYIGAIATTSLALSATNTARPWGRRTDDHGGDEAGGIGPTQSHAIGFSNDDPAADPAAVGGAPVSAGTGHAALVGALAVPHSWAVAAPEIRLAVEALPTAGPNAVASSLGVGPGIGPAALVSGMALAGLASRGAGGADGRAGSDADSPEEEQPKRKPTVVVLQPQPPPPVSPDGGSR